MKIIFTVLAQLLFILCVKSQEIIRGKVTDQESKNPIVNAKVDVFHLDTLKPIYSVRSNEIGDFTINKAIADTVFITVEASGYKPQRRQISTPDFIEIYLIKDSTSHMIEEVLIAAKRNAITLKGDKMIYAIDQMGIGVGNNGLEMMQQLPGISLDKDENIQFRGSTGVQIMINGKKSMLQGDALREYIRNLRSEDIQSVEIIAQPSARYDAAGTTGILNIVLKSNTAKSYGGTLYTSGNYGEYFGAQAGSRLYYNDERWSVNVNGSYYKGRSFNDRTINQTIQLAEEQRTLLQRNYWLPTTESTNLNVAIERKLSKNQLLSTEWKWNTSYATEQTEGNTVDFKNGQQENEVKLTKSGTIPINQYSGNIFYNFTSDSLTTKIDAQLNYGQYKKTIDGFQQNADLFGNLSKLSGYNRTNYTMINGQLDWKQKISEPLELEGGVKFAAIDMLYYNQYKALLGTDFIIPDSLLINDFKYKEKLAAAYTQMHYTHDGWRFLGGLRIENYRYTAISLINQKTNENQSINWFPSASISYQQQNHQYRVSYSKRIGRPAYLALNPYFQYLDAYSIERGNPELKPQFYHSFEINYIYKDALSLGLYGYRYTNGFVDVIDYNKEENYNILYKSNASVGTNYGLSASMPFRVGTYWNMQYSFQAYTESEQTNIPNYSYNGRGYGYEFSIYQRFTLPKNWIISWNGFFNGKTITPTGYSPLVYDFSASIRKTVWKEKLQLVAGCTNILKNSKWNSYSTVNNVATHWVNKWETRKFNLQFVYSFGGNKEKKIKSTSFSEEQKRM